MIFLFMGGFILAKAMMTHGIDKRFAYWLLSRSWVGSNPRRIFLAVGLAAASAPAGSATQPLLP